MHSPCHQLFSSSSLTDHGARGQLFHCSSHPLCRGRRRPPFSSRTRGPSASALCYPAPSTGPLQARLPESGICLGQRREGHRVRHHLGCSKPSAPRSHHWSCLPFTVTGTSDSTRPVTILHITLVLQATRHLLGGNDVHR